MSDEVQYLTDLQSHPGWLLFLQYARKQWGPEGYGRQLKQAVMTATATKDNVEAAVRAVDTANNEIGALLDWPKTRLKQLAQQTAQAQGEPMVSRRGPNL
jgi:hypothetical protein